MFCVRMVTVPARSAARSHPPQASERSTKTANRLRMRSPEDKLLAPPPALRKASNEDFTTGHPRIYPFVLVERRLIAGRLAGAAVVTFGTRATSEDPGGNNNYGSTESCILLGSMSGFCCLGGTMRRQKSDHFCMLSLISAAFLGTCFVPAWGADAAGPET